MTQNSHRLYSLKKARQILIQANDWYKKKWNTLSAEQLHGFEIDLAALDQAILQKNQVEADLLSRRIEKYTKAYIKKSFKGFFIELVIALVLALVIATVIRQIWFEPYEIPTGSMRPTFKEQDHLIVSKTTFGINYPLRTEHLYFDPSLVQRTSVVIFSGENIDLPDTDTSYFWIFPYKKRYIKRCMGKPGDSLYFYGGKLYGMDQNGRELTELWDNSRLERLEYLPFTTFEGRIGSGTSSSGLVNQILFRHMDKPLGRFLFESNGKVTGEIFDGFRWIRDNPQALLTPHKSIETYSDFWGFRNFAMARLLTKEQVEQLTDIDVKTLEKGILYLELRHTPSLTYPTPRLLWDDNRRLTPLISPYVSIIPLQESHLSALMDNMYTSRFIVSRGYATKYSLQTPRFGSTSPSFPNVSDGTYEFYYGRAYKVVWGGITVSLPPDHPLYKRDPQNIQKLFNLGIEMSTVFSPLSTSQVAYPARYAYFRDGALYLLGAPILKKDDPTLISFQEKEKQREQQANPERPYIAFKDYGPPFREGKLDQEFIKTFGFTIPDRHYLFLGDNHAMSADSRYFGFVPQENLQGSPSLVVWPPTSFGIPNQKPYPWITLPNLLVWGLAATILMIWYILHRIRLRHPIFKKLSP